MRMETGAVNRSLRETIRPHISGVKPHKGMEDLAVQKLPKVMDMNEKRVSYGILMKVAVMVD